MEQVPAAAQEELDVFSDVAATFHRWLLDFRLMKESSARSYTRSLCQLLDEDGKSLAGMASDAYFQLVKASPANKRGNNLRSSAVRWWKEYWTTVGSAVWTAGGPWQKNEGQKWCSVRRTQPNAGAPANRDVPQQVGQPQPAQVAPPAAEEKQVKKKQNASPRGPSVLDKAATLATAGRTASGSTQKPVQKMQPEEPKVGKTAQKVQQQDDANLQIVLRDADCEGDLFLRFLQLRRAERRRLQEQQTAQDRAQKQSDKKRRRVESKAASNEISPNRRLADLAAPRKSAKGAADQDRARKSRGSGASVPPPPPPPAKADRGASGSRGSAATVPPPPPPPAKAVRGASGSRRRAPAATAPTPEIPRRRGRPAKSAQKKAAAATSERPAAPEDATRPPHRLRSRGLGFRLRTARARAEEDRGAPRERARQAEQHLSKGLDRSIDTAFREQQSAAVKAAKQSAAAAATAAAAAVQARASLAQAEAAANAEEARAAQAKAATAAATEEFYAVQAQTAQMQAAAQAQASAYSSTWLPGNPSVYSAPMWPAVDAAQWNGGPPPLVVSAPGPPPLQMPAGQPPVQGGTPLLQTQSGPPPLQIPITAPRPDTELVQPDFGSGRPVYRRHGSSEKVRPTIDEAEDAGIARTLQEIERLGQLLDEEDQAGAATAGAAQSSVVDLLGEN